MAKIRLGPLKTPFFESPTRSGFPYRYFLFQLLCHPYPCAAGKVLPFRKSDTTADGNWSKSYWATCQDYQQCPLKPTCVPGAKRKQLTRTHYDAPYRRAWQRQQSRRGQRMRRVRQSTVESVFGHLLHHDGLRRMNVRARGPQNHAAHGRGLQPQKAAQAPAPAAGKPSRNPAQAAAGRHQARLAAKQAPQSAHLGARKVAT